MIEIIDQSMHATVPGLSSVPSSSGSSPSPSESGGNVSTSLNLPIANVENLEPMLENLRLGLALRMILLTLFLILPYLLHTKTSLHHYSQCQYRITGEWQNRILSGMVLCRRNSKPWRRMRPRNLCLSQLEKGQLVVSGCTL